MLVRERVGERSHILVEQETWRRGEVITNSWMCGVETDGNDLCSVLQIWNFNLWTVALSAECTSDH